MITLMHTAAPVPLDTSTAALPDALSFAQNVDGFSANVVAKYFGFLPGPASFWLVPNLGGSSNGQKGRNNLSDVLLPLSAPSAPQPRPSRLIRAATRSSKVHEWRCCDREGGVLDRERGNKVVDHWRS